MIYMTVKQISRLVLLLAVLGLALPSVPVARADDDNLRHNRPELPSPICDDIEVQPGNRLALRAYAVGVQIYRWDGTAWGFVEPVATLYADANHHKKIGVHYGGPTWQSNSGGKVVATRVSSCTPEPNALSWLLLQAVSTDEPGVFSSVTYIQRLNTVGGLAPTAPGSSTGAIAEVPYTADYYFYRARN